MLVTDVGDKMCCWQVKDVGDRFNTLKKNANLTEKSRQHNDSVTSSIGHNHNVVTPLLMGHKCSRILTLQNQNWSTLVLSQFIRPCFSERSGRGKQKSLFDHFYNNSTILGKKWVSYFNKVLFLLQKVLIKGYNLGLKTIFHLIRICYSSIEI